jgi:Fe-S-cluster containining protein
MELDCKNQHCKCKAECCGFNFFESELWEKNQNKIISKPIEIQSFPDLKQVRPKTESGYCPFLRKDYHCNIYENRPEICREFGSESTPFMSCAYLKKDGTERSRQERRSIQRMISKDCDRLGI